jgi:hypothetical protein
MGWITINGTHVEVNEKGEVIKGPASLKSKSSGSNLYKNDPFYAAAKSNPALQKFLAGRQSNINKAAAQSAAAHKKFLNTSTGFKIPKP